MHTGLKWWSHPFFLPRSYFVAAPIKTPRVRSRVQQLQAGQKGQHYTQFLLSTIHLKNINVLSQVQFSLADRIQSAAEYHGI